MSWFCCCCYSCYCVFFVTSGRFSISHLLLVSLSVGRLTRENTKLKSPGPREKSLGPDSQKKKYIHIRTAYTNITLLRVWQKEACRGRSVAFALDILGFGPILIRLCYCPDAMSEINTQTDVRIRIRKNLIRIVYRHKNVRSGCPYRRVCSQLFCRVSGL